ncbi:MAG: CPBP family intramembrane metalloprotease [Planctomycetes bacterium]|nr:CPBP family intramembrane metalloprotease [Planctomycetota bacterium]
MAMPLSVCVAIGGGVWCVIYERSESLWAPWLSHALIDAAIMGVGYWMLWDKLT